jgi:hypothetical protein
LPTISSSATLWSGNKRRHQTIDYCQIRIALLELPSTPSTLISLGSVPNDGSNAKMSSFIVYPPVMTAANIFVPQVTTYTG